MKSLPSHRHIDTFVEVRSYTTPTASPQIGVDESKRSVIRTFIEAFYRIAQGSVGKIVNT